MWWDALGEQEINEQMEQIPERRQLPRELLHSRVLACEPHCHAGYSSLECCMTRHK